MGNLHNRTKILCSSDNADCFVVPLVLECFHYLCNLCNRLNESTQISLKTPCLSCANTSSTIMCIVYPPIAKSRPFIAPWLVELDQGDYKVFFVPQLCSSGNFFPRKHCLLKTSKNFNRGFYNDSVGPAFNHVTPLLISDVNKYRGRAVYWWSRANSINTKAKLLSCHNC